MTKYWRSALAVGVVCAVAAVVIWVGLAGQHSTPTRGAAVHSSASVVASASPSPSASASSTIPMPGVAGIPGIIHPQGKPEFSATFSGSTLDKSVWATCYPYQSFNFSTGCTNFGNIRHEDEWYTPSQVQVGNGTLNLIAQREPTAGYTSNGSAETYSCRSGMVTTYPGLQFQYGYIQIVANIPSGPGLWPALWLAAANLQWPPEMDILEAWGSGQSVDGPPYAAVYYHFSTPTNNDAYIKATVAPPTLAIGWHTFALSWTATQMTWLLDGRAIMTTYQHIPQQKMFLIANLAEAVSTDVPNVPPGQCSGDLQIRSVAVWAP